MFRWIIFIVFVLLVEVYAFQAFKTLFRLRWKQYLYVLFSAAVLFYIIYSFTQFDRKIGQTSQTLFTFGLLLVIYLPKMILTIILFGEDFFRLIFGIITCFMGDKSNKEFFLDRRKFVSQVAVGIEAIPFLSLFYGMTTGKYNFKVIKQTLFFPDLPQSFNGTTITNISDIYSF